jgi:carboxylesterase type B
VNDVPAQSYTDAHYRCPTLFAARALSGVTPVFLYRFVHKPDCVPEAKGVYHGSELPFVFGNDWLPCGKRVSEVRPGCLPS